MKKQGLLLVLSGPSGVGKGTVKSAIVKEKAFPFEYSVSMTTRKPRPGEVDGKDYFFVSDDRFQQAIQKGDLLEYNHYVGHYYGTPLAPLKKMLKDGIDVLLEIDVNGAKQVRKQLPDGVFIFLTPPDLHTLKGRIKGRGTNTDAEIAQRMQQARKEILMMADYDYAVVNDKVDHAVAKIADIVQAEHVSVKRVLASYQAMVKED